MTSFYQKMLNLEEGLTSADLDTLNEITLAQEKTIVCTNISIPILL